MLTRLVVWTEPNLAVEVSFTYCYTCFPHRAICTFVTMLVNEVCPPFSLRFSSTVSPGSAPKPRDEFLSDFIHREPPEKADHLAEQLNLSAMA